MFTRGPLSPFPTANTLGLLVSAGSPALRKILLAQYHRGYTYGHHQAPPPTSHKQYFPATATYASAPNPYSDPTAIGVGSQVADYTAAGYPPVHAMAHEIVGMVPSWGSRTTTPYGGVYMDSAPESYGGYGSSSLVHCPAPYSGAHYGHGTPTTTESQSPSFSFSGAASLPTTSTGAGRLLPNPTAGTGTSHSSLPYAGGTAMKTSSQPGVSSPPANVAASATAYGGFDGLPASYGSASTVSAGHTSLTMRIREEGGWGW
ncbi:hypothetical protein B0H65DRAFT_552612 [Neurospora tetraspora]|uniref:Uncharacterized protein n=1 Tax=Neurospora tetraspora TaxID=94610 RepID=A0AAE0J702_9PEZI|nr:hypothetical protein B0H65DRAFT_552612 [Neurospora tetraspora]